MLIFHVEGELCSFESALKLSGLCHIIISLFGVTCRKNKLLPQSALNLTLGAFLQSLLGRKSNNYYIRGFSQK